MDSNDDEEKQQIEIRYGKSVIKRLVDGYLEEKANAEWIDEHSTGCPSCGVRVEKSVGCNHMTCQRCQAHFCFRCGTSLKGNPDAHFQAPGPCFNRLFDFDPRSQGGDGLDMVDWGEVLGGL